MTFRILASMLFGVLPMSNAYAVECASLGSLIGEISTALDEALMDEALAKAKAGEEALLCQVDPVSPLILTTLFGLKGAVHLYRGEERDAERAFEWSVAVAPSASLDQVFGEKATDLYNQVRERVLNTPMGRIEIQDNARVWIDGKETTPGTPTDLAAGPHLVQWQKITQNTGLDPGVLPPLKTLKIILTPGETRSLLLTGVQADASGQEKGQLRRDFQAWQKAGGNPVLIKGGGAVLGGGVAALALSAMRHQKFLHNATAPEDLDGLAFQVNALTVLGLTAGSVGASALGLGLVSGGEGTAVAVGGRF